MQVNTKAIVLTAIKYGDTSLIVKAFTQTDGIKSYLLKGVLASKKGKLKTAYFQPLTQLELTANHKNKGTLETIIEAKILYSYTTLHSDIIKNSLVLFLAEMLSNCIQEQQQDDSLYSYIEYSLQWLDTNNEIANFHILFLLNLTKFLGFYPDTSEISFFYFDLLEGTFIPSPSINPIIKKENINCFKNLLGINFDTLKRIKIAKANREALLKSVILYYELHLQGFRKPKSLDVLNAVFD